MKQEVIVWIIHRTLANKELCRENKDGYACSKGKFISEIVWATVTVNNISKHSNSIREGFSDKYLQANDQLWHYSEKIRSVPALRRLQQIISIHREDNLISRPLLRTDKLGLFSV